MSIALFIILIALSACASVDSSYDFDKTDISAKAGLEIINETGLDEARLKEAGLAESNLTKKQKKAIAQLKQMLKKEGLLDPSNFDPNKLKSPDFQKPIFKEQVKKQEILDELLSEAYESYKHVSGTNWYPKRAVKQKKSNDPRLDPNWWRLAQGRYLHDVLAEWGRRAQWRVIWRSDYQYPIASNASFRGDFPQVIQKVLKAFESREPTLYAAFYNNRVVIFHNQPNGENDENAEIQ